MPDSPRLVALAVAQPLILLVAWVMGRGAYGLLRFRLRLPAATTTIASVVGMALGFAVVGWVIPGLELWSPLALGAAFAGAVLVLAIVTAVALGTAGGPEPLAIEEQARLGESDVLEFKSSARVSMATGQKDERMETVILKTIAAFSNSRGGTLLIGVDDDGRLIGLDPDLATLKQPDADRFELWLRDALHHRMGANAAAPPKVDFAPAPAGSIVCRVQCPPALAPVYLRSGKGAAATTDFWVRVGNSTRSLGLADAVEYISRRWPTSVATSARHNLREIGSRLRGRP